MVKHVSEFFGPLVNTSNRLEMKAPNTKKGRVRKLYTIGKNNPFLIMAATKVMQTFLKMHDRKFHTSITHIKEFNFKEVISLKRKKNAGGQFSVRFLIFSLLFLFHRKNLYAETCV